jgi:hypothetical protein
VITRARAIVSASFVFTVAAVAALSSGAVLADQGGIAVTLDYTPLGEQTASSAGTSAAPADINFGIYPLSVLGIENTIRSAETRVGDYARGIERVDDGPIAYSVVAIRDWEHRYPHDPWIAKDLLALAKFYAHIGTPDGRARATAVAEWIRHDYPVTASAGGAENVVAEMRGLGDASSRPEVATLPREEAATERRADVRPERAAPEPPVNPAPPAATVLVDLPNPVPRRTAIPRAPGTQPTLPPYAHYETPQP